ncbi:hypothetical protein ACSDR0_29085 [Streptosporangium sp. G11]|uniref:hypothetical protein n=1 Tax=Streptosporangium sp. G11 TaxID=3436926 RepID=UPI003EB73FE0
MVVVDGYPLRRGSPTPCDIDECDLRLPAAEPGRFGVDPLGALAQPRSLVVSSRAQVTLRWAWGGDRWPPDLDGGGLGVELAASGPAAAS